MNSHYSKLRSTSHWKPKANMTAAMSVADTCHWFATLRTTKSTVLVNNLSHPICSWGPTTFIVDFNDRLDFCLGKGIFSESRVEHEVGNKNMCVSMRNCFGVNFERFLFVPAAILN